MISNEREVIKKWMFDTHRVPVQDDWLIACLDWIQEEQQESNANIGDIKNLVFEQWLMSDLRELGSQCLPDGLHDHIKIELNGSYPLQIESIVEVGSSYYSQLQKLKGTENANSGVTADTTIQPAWEQKPSKMLYLKLTDGTSDIQGMEYKPIQSLSTDTTLGTKMLVYGNVICRRGVLLLTSDNTHVYGGEVDSLMENNPPSVLLQKALDENASCSGRTERKELSGKFLERGESSFKIKTESCSQWKSSTQQSQLHKTTFKQDTTIKQEPTKNIKQEYTKNIKQEYTKNIKHEPTVNSNSSSRIQQLQDTGWDDDFDDDMFMDDIDDQVLMSIETDIIQQPSAFKSEENSVRTNNQNQNNLNASNNSGRNCSTSINLDQAYSSTNRDNVRTDNFSHGRGSSSNQTTNVTNRQKGVTNRQQGVKSNRELTNTPVSRNKRPKLEAKQQKLENMFLSTKREVSVAKPSGSADPRQLQDLKDRLEMSEHHFNDFDDDLAALDDEDFDIPETFNNSVKLDVPKAVIHPFNTSSASETAVNENEPFTYLSVISDKMPFTTEQTFKLKAYISTLTSRLTSAQGESWTLSCKINDGTLAIDADLSNDVLAGLIGFSAKDSIVMRKKAKTDPSVVPVLKEGIQQCQQKLVDLSCILHIKVAANSIRPVITDIIPIEKHHLHLLLNRIQCKLKQTDTH